MGNMCGNTNGVAKENRPTCTGVDTKIFGELIGTKHGGDWRDEYTVIKKLGAGITGAVYKVEHKKMKGKMFAVKSVNLDKLDAMQLKELRNEVALLKKLDHPHIVRLYETYESEMTIDLVMELLEGGDLYDGFKKNPENFTETKVATLINQLLSAISYVHSFGIIHRDIKPANVCFRDESYENIVLIDFGIGRLAPTKSTNRFYTAREKLTMCGTPVYVAPEILTGVYTEKVDIWAVGILTHQYLVGNCPFESKSQNRTLELIERHKKLSFAHKKWLPISDAAKSFIQSMLNPNHEERPSAKAAMEHSWFQRIAKSKSGDVSTRHEDVFLNIQSFARYSPIKKMAMMAVAHTLDGDQLDKLRNIFEELDTDNTGTLSKDEIEAHFNRTDNIDTKSMSTEETEKFFASLDFDKTGIIRYGEFLAAAMDASSFLKKNSLRVAFDRLDKDQSGAISVENLKAIAGKVYDEATIQAILKGGDIKENGVIDWEEFCELMGPG